MHPEISVIAPVRNSARTLPELCRRIRGVLPDCEIVLVDDASDDESAAVMRQLTDQAIVFRERRGQNAAIRAGLARARGRTRCVLDADLEDPPEALPRLLAPIRQGAARVAFSTRDGRRRLTSRLFRRAMHLIFPSLPPRACLCFAVDAEAAAALVDRARPTDYLVAVIGAMALPATEVPIRREPQPERVSGYAGLRRSVHGLRMLASALRLRLGSRAAEQRPAAAPGTAMPPMFAHNRQQRDYFQRSMKRTMMPRASAYLSRHVDELIAHAGLAPGQRVLEVGCGMGRYTLLLAGRGLAVEGLDLAPALLDKLRDFNAGRFHIPLHAGDVIDCAERFEGGFDAVIGFFTLHHVHALDACYAAMARIVRPGGRVVFLEPNPYNPSYYIQILATPGMTWKGERGMVRVRRGPIFSAMRQAGLVEPRLQRLGLFPPAIADRKWAPGLERAAEAWLGWTGCLAFQIFSGRRPRE